MSRFQNAFTLIELIVTLVLIGVLAAAVIPKFYDLAPNAREVLIKTGAGAIRTAAHIVRLKVMTSGLPIDSTIRQVDLGDGTMIDVKYGYPTCSANGIIKAMTVSEQYVWYFGGGDLCSMYPNRGLNSNGTTVYMSNCAVMYDVQAGSTWSPVISGC